MILLLVAHLTAVAEPATSAPESPAWYQVVVGILTIPTTFFGVFASYYLVKKTRNESKRLAQELEQNELKVVQANDAPTAAARIVSGPVFEGRKAQDILVRFVLLYLVLQAWGLVSGLFQVASSGGEYALFNAMQQDHSSMATIGYVAIGILGTIPSVVSALLFVAIGLPLLLDITKLLNLQLPNWAFSSSTRILFMIIAVIGALGEQLVGVGISAFAL